MNQGDESEDESIVYKISLSNIFCLANLDSINNYRIESLFSGDLNNSHRYLSKGTGHCFVNNKIILIKSLSNRCSGFFYTLTYP